MKNENWGCWFVASIIKHFQDNVKDVDLVVTGQEILRDRNRLELSIDGPIIRESSNNYYNLKFIVRGVLSYYQNDTNILKYPMLKGHCASAFTRHICCYRYGPGFDQSQFAFLTELGEVDINDFGKVDDTARLMVAVIENRYQTQLSGES